MRKAFFAALVLAVAVASFLVGRESNRNSPSEPLKVKTDTLFRHDTISISAPVYVEKRKIDSILVPVTDTVRVRDTLFVTLERDQVEWRDSLSAVYVSGVRPQVDSVVHFVPRVDVVRTVVEKERSRWGLGVSAGYGATREGLSPFIGLGISYSLMSW